MKITRLTERKIIDVRSGYIAGSPPRIEVDVCVKCASVVFDPVQHFKWHQERAEYEENA